MFLTVCQVRFTVELCMSIGSLGDKTMTQNQARREASVFSCKRQLPLLPGYSTLVGGAPGSRSSPAVPQREEAQREHEDCGQASRQRTVYGEVGYDHHES